MSGVCVSTAELVPSVTRALFRTLPKPIVTRQMHVLGFQSSFSEFNKSNAGLFQEIGPTFNNGCLRQTWRAFATASSDLYAMLGVERKATTAEIKKAYYQKAKTCHPDLHPNDPGAVVRFRELSEAYSVLSDATKRSSYDRGGFRPFGSQQQNGAPRGSSRQGSSTGQQYQQYRPYTDADARSAFESLFADAAIVGEFVKTYAQGVGSDLANAASATAAGNFGEAGSIIAKRPFLFGSMIPVALIVRFPQLILAAGVPILRILLPFLTANPRYTLELGNTLWREIVKTAQSETEREKRILQEKSTEASSKSSQSSSSSSEQSSSKSSSSSSSSSSSGTSDTSTESSRRKRKF